MNSRNKGKVGEREFAALLREQGFDARRGQQFSGGAESPDVVSEELAWLHFEIKRVEKLNLIDACSQAEGDSQGKPWVVAHRRNHAPWLVTLRAEFFFELLREFQPGRDTNFTNSHEGETPGTKIQTPKTERTEGSEGNKGGPEDDLGCGDGRGQ